MRDVLLLRLKLLCMSVAAMASKTVAALAEVCESNTESAVGQRALLQATHKVANVKAAPGTSLLSETDYRSSINPSGAAAPLTEDGYAAVADRCCVAEMREFIERHVLDLGYTICEAAGLDGIVPYHSCEKGPQTLAKLTSDILADSTQKCTWVRMGECTEIPADCEQYVGIIPADCGCSRSQAAKIDLITGEVTHNNLGGLGPDTGAEEFRVALQGSNFDLVITTLTTYESDYYFWNGVYAGFGAINVNCPGGPSAFSGNVTFLFSFMEPGTNNPVLLPEVHMAIFDLDGEPGLGGAEFVESKAYKGYVTDATPSIIASRLDDGRTRFDSEGSNNNLPNPTDPTTLTDEQRRNSVMYFYTNVSSFELSFGISPPSIGVGRWLYFSCESELNDRCGP